MSNLILKEFVHQFRKAKGEETRFTYHEINYSKISSSTAQVGYGYIDEPYTSAVPIEYDKDIIIPTTVQDTAGIKYTVTTIGDHAFYRCTKIKKITIPYSVKVIGWSSLAILSLEEIIIAPNSQLKEIKTDFIYLCKNLSTFVYPNNKITISQRAFYSQFHTKFYYCGNQKVTVDFECGDHCPTISVPMNYPYSSFGNLSILREDFCVSRNEITYFLTKKTKYSPFIFLFLIF